MEAQLLVSSPSGVAGARPTGSESAVAPTSAENAQLEPTPYEVVARWEYRMHGEVRRTIIMRHFTVSSEPDGPNRRLTLLATPPVLRQPDLTALEELTVQLAALYQRLVLRVAPTGQLLALLNHAELLQTWAHLEPELAARFGTGEPNELTALVLAAVGQQVQRPEDVLASLHYDYAYELLLKNWLRPGADGQEQAFPHFFADTTIHFHMQQPSLPALAAGRASYRLHGTLAEPRTDRAAAARQVAAELAPTADPIPSLPPPNSLVFAYAATYEVEVATGWPRSIEATVSCQGPAGYAKEYDLTITQL